MRKYEAMFIVKPDLAEDEKKALFNQLGDAVIKNKGEVSQAGVWAEKRKIHFRLKKYDEVTYYLMSFSLTDPLAIREIKRIYRLNENILRVLITRPE